MFPHDLTLTCRVALGRAVLVLLFLVSVGGTGSTRPRAGSAANGQVLSGNATDIERIRGGCPAA